jgi:hypothetical protein
MQNILKKTPEKRLKLKGQFERAVGCLNSDRICYTIPLES